MLTDRSLTDADFAAAATRIDLEEAVIRAVAEVESAGGGFLPAPDERPKILFERHIFWRELRRAGHDPHDYTAGNEDILSTARGGYLGGAREYPRLERAKVINKGAALRSASYGRWQIMGFNRHHCGFDSIFEFVAAMQVHERDHLAAFLQLVSSWGLVPAMRAHRWEEVALRYNGPGNVAKYSALLARAYEGHRI